MLDLDLRRSKENLEEIYPINYWVKIKGEVCEFGGNKYATGGYGGHGGHGGQKKMDNS